MLRAVDGVDSLSGMDDDLSSEELDLLHDHSMLQALFFRNVSCIDQGLKGDEKLPPASFETFDSFLLQHEYQLVWICVLGLQYSYR